MFAISLDQTTRWVEDITFLNIGKYHSENPHSDQVEYIDMNYNIVCNMLVVKYLTYAYFIVQ